MSTTTFPGTVLDRPQPTRRQAPVFPQITHLITTAAAKEFIQRFPSLSLHAARFALRDEAIRSWEQLGGGSLVGWSFTVDGMDFYGELDDDSTKLTITVR